MEELSIQKTFNNPPIEWNYEKYRAWLLEETEKYKHIVYTEDNIAEAKADQVVLNKLYDQIEAAKRDVKKAYSVEVVKFESQVKDLLAIITDAKTNCHNALEDHDKKLKDEKMQFIRDKYAEIFGDMVNVVPLTTIFNEKWLNASYKEKEVENDLKSNLINIKEGLAVLDRMTTPFKTEVKRVFFETLNLQEAMKVNDRLLYLEDLERQTAENKDDLPFTVTAEITATEGQLELLKEFCCRHRIDLNL